MGIERSMWGVMALAIAMTNCAVQTEVRTGTQGAEPARPGARTARPSPRPRPGVPGPTTPRAEPAATATRTELKAVPERELTMYRSLIQGDDDKIVLDPKMVDATNNIYTRNHKERVEALEKHAAGYDVPATIAVHPTCEAAIEAILTRQGEEPIRQDEDDVQYARRKESGAKGLGMFRRALSSPADATRPDLKFTYRLLAGKYDNPSGRPIAGPNARSPLEQQVDGVAERGLCNAKFLLVVNEWWKRQRAELDGQRQAAQDTKNAEARGVVLARRFAPVSLECSENWRATTEKCAELPGLSEDERKACTDACAAAAEEGFKRSFTNAIADCFIAETNGAKACELKKPAGSTISDEQVTKGIASCKTECATKVREDKQQGAKDHQECLGFCRDLRNGFCSMTEKPKQPACIDRCIRVKCSGS